MRSGKLLLNFTDRLFRSFLSLALILMGLTGVTVSLNSMYVLKENAIENNRQILTQFSNSVNTTFTYVDNMMSHFVADQKIRDFLDYYDSMNIDVITSVATQFQNFMLSNRYIDSMAIYYPLDERVYAANYGVISTQEYFDGDFFKNLDDADISSVWKTPRTIAGASGRPVSLFSIVKPLKYRGNELAAILIVNLDASFFTQIFNSISLDEQSYLAMNDDAVIVACSDSGKAFLSDGGKIYAALPRAGSGTLALNGEKYLISCVDSSGWKYYCLIKIDVLYKEMQTLLFFSAIILMTGSIIAICFSRIFSNRLAAPIVTIASQFDQKANTSQEKDMLKHIEQGIAMLKEENLSIQQSLEQSMPVLKNNFLISMLGGYITDPDEIDRNLTYFKIDIDRSCPVFASIIKINEFDPQTGEKYQPRQLHSFITYLTGLLAATFSDTAAYLLCHSYEDEITMLSVLTDPSRREGAVLHTGKMLERLFENERKHISVIGAGSIENSVYYAGRSYVNAKKTLSLCFLSKELFISYEEIALISSHTAKYPFESEERLIVAIRSNSPENAESCLKEMINRIFAGTHENRNVRTYFLLQLYSALQKYANEANIVEFFLNEASKYTEIIELTEERVYPWFHELTESLITHALYKKANPERFLSERIKEYLEKNYQKDFSVAELSDVFMYSPAHMSRIFHRETGYTIKQYLTKIRMDAACRLLGNYSLKISEVGEMTGYPKVHAFLKQFKNYTGITPSEYRENLLKFPENS